MLGYDGLENDNQRKLYDALKEAIENGSAVDNVFNGKTEKNIKDIQAVLGTYVEMNDGAFITFLMYALEQNEISIAEAILENADKDTLKKLLKEESIVTYTDNSLKSHIAFSYAIEQQEKFGEKFVTMIEDKMKNVCPEVLIPYSKPRAGVKSAHSPAAQATAGVHTVGGQGQAQGVGSVLTLDKLMENFYKLTPKQKSLHKRLSDTVYSGGNVYNVLKDIKKDKDKKDILTTSAVYSGQDMSIPGKIREKFVSRNLLTFAIALNNVQATKEILQECKQLGILKQVLTTQSITIVDGHQEDSRYALHHAILRSDTKFCTEILNAASDEPDLLQTILGLEFIYTKNADGTETYTPLALAELEENRAIIDIINRKMQENGLADSNQHSQQPVSTGGEPSPAAQTAPGVLAPAQNNLYYDLKGAIEKGDGVTSILQGQGKQDIKKALLQASRLEEPPLYIAVVQINERAVKELLNEAEKVGILRDVLTQKVGPFNKPLFSYAINESQNGQIVKIIEQKANGLGLIDSNQQSQPRAGTSNGAFVELNETPIPAQSGQGQAQGGGSISHLAKLTKDFNELMSNAGLAASNHQSQQPVGTGNGAFVELNETPIHTQSEQRQAQGGRDTRDQQQETFDELCNLVSRINGANGAEQGQLIDKFSQKLDEALSSGFDFSEDYEVVNSHGQKETTVQLVIRNSNNQKCIETFLSKILLSIQNNADKEKEIFDTVKSSLNIESIKAFFSVKKEKDSSVIDSVTSDISKHLIAQVREMKPQKIDNFETLGKIKTILEFFLSEQNVKEQTKSVIQGYLNITEKKMETEKPFSREASQAQFSSPPHVVASNRTPHTATPGAPTVLPQGSPPPVFVPASGQSSLFQQAKKDQPNQPHVVAGNLASSAVGATSGQSSLPPKVTKQAQPIQPHVAVPVSLEAEPTPGQSPLSPGSAQNQLTGTDDVSSPGNTSALPNDLGDQITKTPTFWNKNRGKTAACLYIVGFVVACCAFIAGLPYEAACAMAVIGVVITAIAVGILGKMAYEEVSEQAKIDNTTKVKAAGTMLSSVLPKWIKPQDESKNLG